MSTIDDMKDYQTSSGIAYQVFPKLHSDNYFSWCTSMELVLRSLNEWEVVTSTLISLVCVVEKSPTGKSMEVTQGTHIVRYCISYC